MNKKRKLDRIPGVLSRKRLQRRMEMREMVKTIIETKKEDMLKAS